MESHRVKKDNYIIKSGYQGKDVVNKVTVYEIWFDFGMIPRRSNM
jgi:hypothetical protein